MKKTQTITYTQDDYDLLKKPLPPNPCDTCGAGYECCGCPKGYEHKEKIQPYKDSDIYDIAILLYQRQKKLNQIAALTAEIQDIDGKLFGETYALDKSKLNIE